MTDPTQGNSMNPLDDSTINPLLHDAVTAITQGMAEAFEQVWSRPDADQLIEGFLEGNITFYLDRQGVTILAPNPPSTNN